MLDSLKNLHAVDTWTFSDLKPHWLLLHIPYDSVSHIPKQNIADPPRDTQNGGRNSIQPKQFPRITNQLKKKSNSILLLTITVTPFKVQLNKAMPNSDGSSTNHYSVERKIIWNGKLEEKNNNLPSLERRRETGEIEDP